MTKADTDTADDISLRLKMCNSAIDGNVEGMTKCALTYAKEMAALAGSAGSEPVMANLVLMVGCTLATLGMTKAA